MRHSFTGKERSIQGRLPSPCGATFPNLCFGLILLMFRLLAVDSLEDLECGSKLRCCPTVAARAGGPEYRSKSAMPVPSKVHPKDVFQSLLHATAAQHYR